MWVCVRWVVGLCVGRWRVSRQCAPVNIFHRFRPLHKVTWRHRAFTTSGGSPRSCREPRRVSAAGYVATWLLCVQHCGECQHVGPIVFPSSRWAAQKVNATTPSSRLFTSLAIRLRSITCEAPLGRRRIRNGIRPRRWARSTLAVPPSRSPSCPLSRICRRAAPRPASVSSASLAAPLRPFLTRSCATESTRPTRLPRKMVRVYCREKAAARWLRQFFFFVFYEAESARLWLV